MNWLKPKEQSSQPPLCHVLNCLQTNFSNIIRAMPNRFASISSSSDNSRPISGGGGGGAADYALSNTEIKNRMAEIPVYKLSNDSQDKIEGISEFGDRKIRFYFLNKPDALNFKERIECSPDARMFDARLTEVVDFEGDTAPIRLIPELSEVKNAIQEKKKHIAGFPDGVFAGVPVFQSDRLIVKGEGEQKYRPAFLRKTDLEKALANAKAPKQRGTIQVAALEDIIQEMKDCSTSKWNDAVFVAPGKIMDMVFEKEDK
ncbi:hypothetical protein ACP275_14G310100 [Erythranthe tilingii]